MHAHLHIILQHGVESGKELLLQLADPRRVLRGGVSYESSHALEKVVVETRLAGVLTHLQQQLRQVLQADLGRPGNLHEHAMGDGFLTAGLLSW